MGILFRQPAFLEKYLKRFPLGWGHIVNNAHLNEVSRK